MNKVGALQLSSDDSRIKGEKSKVPEEGVEPSRGQAPLDFESSASTSSTTPAYPLFIIPVETVQGVYETSHLLYGTDIFTSGHFRFYLICFSWPPKRVRGHDFALQQDIWSIVWGVLYYFDVSRLCHYKLQAKQPRKPL